MASSIKEPQVGPSAGHTAVGRRPGKTGRYDDWTVYELKMRVKELGMQGYSDKSRAELIDMLHTH